MTGSFKCALGNWWISFSCHPLLQYYQGATLNALRTVSALTPEEESQPRSCQLKAPGLQNADLQLVLASVALQNWGPHEQILMLLVCWHACDVSLEKWCVGTGLKYHPPTSEQGETLLLWSRWPLYCLYRILKEKKKDIKYGRESLGCKEFAGVWVTQTHHQGKEEGKGWVGEKDGWEVWIRGCCVWSWCEENPSTPFCMWTRIKKKKSQHLLWRWEAERGCEVWARPW